MRKVFAFTILLIIGNLTIEAFDVDKITLLALEHIRQGNMRDGVEELKKAAAMNDVAAQYYIAVCYEHGIAVEKDLTLAFKMYRRTAERGLPDAMLRIASFYNRGLLVSRDLSKANDWQRRFTQRGGKEILPDIVKLHQEGLSYVKSHQTLSENKSEEITKEDKEGLNVNNNSFVQNDLQQESIISNPVKNNPSFSSDIETDMISVPTNNTNTFAVIIANEDYQEVENVEFALNDGETFKQYCHQVLGIPLRNIHFRKNATMNNIIAELSWIRQVGSAYKGNANFIIYYAGHGIPDERTGSAYLLPVDGIGTNKETGYSLAKLYETLGNMQAAQVMVFMDACFSGSKRGEGMLASARGVAIKAKSQIPKGKTVVFSAAQGDETAYPLKEHKHGLFTYYLLKKLNDTKGEVTLGELFDYVSSEVKRESIVSNGKMQTPCIVPSATVVDSWKSITLK